jgi:hydrogenase maturation protease
MDMSASPERVIVIGVGNADCADDGIGPLVIATLTGLPQVQLRTCTGDVLSLIDTWSDAAAVVLIDAARCVGVPGRIHRLDLAEADLPYDASISSTHGFGLSETIGLARALQRLPKRMVLYSVEGASFEPGAAMTREVAAALCELQACVSAEVARLNFDRQEETRS